MDYQGGWLPNMPPTIVVSRPAVERQTARQRQDELLDDALKETFPASDPISVIQVS